MHSQSSAPSRPQHLHHPPALTRATRATAATTSGPQTPAACLGQCAASPQPDTLPRNLSSNCLQSSGFPQPKFFSLSPLAAHFFT